MKTKLTLLALVIVIGASMATQAQTQTNQFLMTWTATGYTLNANGKMVVTNVSAQTFINKIAADNGLNPRDLVFVYRVEKRDTAVVNRNDGAFVSDVYQMEYNYTDVTNNNGSAVFRQTALNDEYHNDAQGNPFPIGGTFGVEDKTYNRAGYLVGYSYHGTFNYSLPEDNAVFVGSFSTGARVKELYPTD